jgi:hypothetical protein
LNEFAYKIGLRLSRIGFVRSAIDDRADLTPFKGRPTFRILFGVFLIGFSFLMCWPAISVLTGISVHLRMPLLAIIGGPVLYGMSHLYFLAGMALSGAEYSRIFLRWVARVTVEKFLSFGATEHSREP